MLLQDVGSNQGTGFETKRHEKEDFLNGFDGHETRHKNSG